MKIVLVLSLLPYFLIAQDEVILDLTDRSITINAKTEYEYFKSRLQLQLFIIIVIGEVENKEDTLYYRNKENNKK